MKTAAAKWPKVTPVAHKSGTTAYMVDARINGRGERLFFSTKGEANTKADALRIQRANSGKEGMAFPERLRVEALDAAERLAPVGASLTEAVDYFLKHAKPVGGDRTVAQVVAEFLRLKTDAGLRPEYLTVQKYVLGNVFGGDFGTKMVHEVAHTDIETWLVSRRWVPRTRFNYHRDISNLFGFAMKRGYCAANPMARLEKPKVEKKRPGILTPAQAEALLNFAEASRPIMLPAIAIGLFCGVRSKELERLQWEHVNMALGTITITAEGAKMSEERVIDMPENLKAWLVPHVKANGHVAPQKSFDWLLKDCWTGSKISKWPKNAMRHSFATYHYAQHQNAASTMAMLGHFDNSRTFVNSYRALAQPAEAAKFWAIKPSRPTNVVSIAA